MTRPSWFRVWQAEAAVVAVVLAVVAVLRGGRLEWVGGLAVLLSFMHAQIADRHGAAEADAAARGNVRVTCWRWSVRYFVGKEIAWVVYFVAHRSWSALVGCGLSLIYPLWRRWYMSVIARRRAAEVRPRATEALLREITPVQNLREISQVQNLFYRGQRIPLDGYTPVQNLFYRGQRIQLDGYHFINCRFDDCILSSWACDFAMSGCYVGSNCRWEN